MYNIIPIIILIVRIHVCVCLHAYFVDYTYNAKILYVYICNSLRNNEIGSAGMESLSNALKSNNTIHTLK